MVQRIKIQISDVLKTNYFDSAAKLERTLMYNVHIDKTQLPQSVLSSRHQCGR
jgi:hypothetical protein